MTEYLRDTDELNIKSRNIDGEHKEITVEEHINDASIELPLVLGNGSNVAVAIEAGKVDGQNGFPRKDENGVLTSSFIEMVRHSNSKKTAEILYEQQRVIEADIASLKSYYPRIHLVEDKIKEVESKLKEKEGNPLDITERHRGDDKITDLKLAARRKNEFQHNVIKPIENELAALKDQLRGLIDQAETLRVAIEEVQNSTRLKLAQIHEHTREILAVYYREALLAHPDKDSMPPALPAIELKAVSEDIYLSNHEGILDGVRKKNAYLKHRYDITRDEEIDFEDSHKNISNVFNARYSDEEGIV